MKLTIPLLFVAVTMVSAIPRGPRGPPSPSEIHHMGQNDPNLRKSILDMIMQHLSRADPNVLRQLMATMGRPTLGGNMGGAKPGPSFGPPQPHFPRPQFQFRPQPRPIPHFPPGGNVFMQNPNPPMQHGGRPTPPRQPPPQNSGLLMDVPGGGGYGGHHAGGYGGHAGGMAFGGKYCPPNSFGFGSDTCKDKVIYEALYHKKTGNPLYSWVPPSNRMDPYSISDNVKDQAMNILIQKVMSSPNKKPTQKQRELMRALGDPPNHVKAMFGILY